MAATPGNSINLTGAAGIVLFDGTSAVTTTAPTNHAVLIGTGSNSFGTVGPGTTGQVLQANTSANPTFSTATYPSSSGGTGKILFDNGTNFIESTPTFPASASATSRKIIVSDGTNWVASTETWATPGTSGNVLTSNGTNWTSAAAPAQSLSNLLGNITLIDDFIMVNVTGALLASNFGWSQTSFSVRTNTSNTHPGILGHSSLGSGDANLTSANATGQVVLGGGVVQVNWLVNVATLSTNTNTYTLRVGLSDTVNAAAVNGVYFEYSNGENSGNWVLVTANASTRTSSNTAVAVTTGWHDLQIVVNAAASSITFTIDGAAQTAVTTNIPTATIAPMLDVVWSAGTVAASSIQVDLFYLNYALTTPRT